MSLGFARDHSQDKSVVYAGDWHGSLYWAVKAVQMTAEAGSSLILHLGDFGVWDGDHGKRYLTRLDKACEEYGVDIGVTVGNHEQHARLESLWANQKRRDSFGNRLPLDLGTKHIRIFPRAFRFEISGTSFLSFGGAASVDFDMRSEGKSWWPEEMISNDDVDRAIADGHADIMLTHETPDPPYAIPAVEQILASNPMGFSLKGLAYSSQSRQRLTRAFLGVKPRLLVHGHMHLTGRKEFYWPGDTEPSAVVGLSEELTNGNLWRYELVKEIGTS